MLVRLMVRVFLHHDGLLTVAITVPTVGDAHHHGAVKVSVEVSSLHGVVGSLDGKLGWVRIIWLELLRRKISGVHLLIGLRHPIVRIVNRRSLEPPLFVGIVGIAQNALAGALLGVGGRPNLFSRVLDERVVWREECVNLPLLVLLPL